MYRVVKRDGRVVDFEIDKIAKAMQKAFDATDTNYNDSVIDFLALNPSGRQGTDRLERSDDRRPGPGGPGTG